MLYLKIKWQQNLHIFEICFEFSDNEMVQVVDKYVFFACQFEKIHKNTDKNVFQIRLMKMFNFFCTICDLISNSLCLHYLYDPPTHDAVWRLFRGLLDGYAGSNTEPWSNLKKK